MTHAARTRKSLSVEDRPRRKPAAHTVRSKDLRDPAVLAQFVSKLQEGVYITSPDGTIIDTNPAFLAMFGVGSLKELRCYTAEQLLVDPARRAAELAILMRDGTVREFELEIRRPDGEVRTVLDTAYQVVDPETGERSFHGILIDISDRKQLERQLFQAALRDPLTGCYNRRYLMDRERDLARTNQRWGVIVIDIDHFKQYNDQHGHDTGDRVLVRVARFLMATSRSEDAVLRIGGDEFLLLFSGDAAAATEGVARRLREAGPDGIPVSLSCGWALRKGGERLEETIHRADQRLISVRARTRGFAQPRRTPPGATRGV
jgi:diguanylate cyclase (GGDEF)-like protein/PAS domain S-box-containing protein